MNKGVQVLVNEVGSVRSFSLPSQHAELRTNLPYFLALARLLRDHTLYLPGITSLRQTDTGGKVETLIQGTFSCFTIREIGKSRNPTCEDVL